MPGVKFGSAHDLLYISMFSDVRDYLCESCSRGEFSVCLSLGWGMGGCIGLALCARFSRVTNSKGNDASRGDGGWLPLVAERPSCVSRRLDVSARGRLDSRC